MVVAYVAVALAAVVAALLDSWVDISVSIDEEFAAFAVFYIVAQATERLVEPLMSSIPSATESTQAKQAVKEVKAANQVALAAGAATPAMATAEATAQAQLDAVQRGRAVTGWALASVFALIVCGVLGLGLIDTVATVDGEKRTLFARVDVIVTGLAVGAGTKPLHDLIARLEKGKQKADTATSPPPAP